MLHKLLAVGHGTMTTPSNTQPGQREKLNYRLEALQRVNPTRETQ